MELWRAHRRRFPLFAILAASDRLLIASLIGPAAAGAYSAASSIAERAISLLLLPIAFAIKPQIFIEYNRGGAEPLRRLMKRQSGWLMAAGLPIATLLRIRWRPLWLAPNWLT